MSWFLAFAGFAALIILHEFGHFLVAKAVGMRVERFALFFPPLLVKFRLGETEYGIGAIPLGGYVKITGMTAAEELPEDVAYRAYHRQAPWKRIVVIVAGPAMNVLVAFLILGGLYWANGLAHPTQRVDRSAKLVAPAAGVLAPGDFIVGVDGHGGSEQAVARAIARHRCAGKLTNACEAATPARMVVARHGRRVTFTLRPRYDAAQQKMRIGFAYAIRTEPVAPARAAGLSVTAMWDVTRRTFTAFGKIFQDRKQISGVVGSYETTRQAFKLDTTAALYILAVISLSLAIVNLFPFLPLDGGHVFWALAEKVRGRPIAFAVMERAGVVGFMLVIMLFLLGLSNDIDRLNGGGFGLR